MHCRPLTCWNLLPPCLRTPLPCRPPCRMPPFLRSFSVCRQLAWAPPHRRLLAPSAWQPLRRSAPHLHRLPLPLPWGGLDAWIKKSSPAAGALRGRGCAGLATCACGGGGGLRRGSRRRAVPRGSAILGLLCCLPAPPTRWHRSRLPRRCGTRPMPSPRHAGRRRSHAAGDAGGQFSSSRGVDMYGSGARLSPTRAAPHLGIPHRRQPCLQDRWAAPGLRSRRVLVTGVDRLRHRPEP